MDNLWSSLIVLVAAVWLYMSAWFLLAYQLKRRDAVDSAWGLGFVLVAWLAILLNESQNIYVYLAAGLVSVWGLRLFWHLTARNSKRPEDYRYQAMNLGSWLRTYVVVFMLQGVLLLVISAPVIAIVTTSNEFFRPLAIAGLAIWGFGIAFEAIADRQLQQFITNRKTEAGQIMTGGLWRYSRHPNYFGEIISWLGAGIVATAAGEWWALIGPAVITILLTKISGIPLLEKRYNKSAQYQQYKKRTSVLIPWPPGKNA